MMMGMRALIVNLASYSQEGNAVVSNPSLLTTTTTTTTLLQCHHAILNGVLRASMLNNAKLVRRAMS